MANGKYRVWIIPAVCLMSIVGSWYVRGNDLEHLEADVLLLQQTPIKIAQIETDIVNIKQDVTEIKTEQKESKELLYKIWGKMNGH